MRTHAPRPPSRASWLGALVLLVPAALLLAQAPAADGPVTVEDARRFIAEAEETLNTLGVRASRAAWVQSTYITSDTQAIAAETREAQITAATDFAKQAARYRSLELPPDLARKLMLLRLQLTMPAPANGAERA
jgi:peptidyl-dipeptidase A